MATGSPVGDQWQDYQPPRDVGGYSVSAAEDLTPKVSDTGVQAAHKVKKWAENMEHDLRYGTDLTGVGYLLQKMGAHGLNLGTSEGAADILGSIPLGLMRSTKGTAELGGGDVGQGAKDMVGGAMQSATIPGSFIAPEASDEEGVAGKGLAKAADAVGDAWDAFKNLFKKQEPPEHVPETVRSLPKPTDDYSPVAGTPLQEASKGGSLEVGEAPSVGKLVGSVKPGEDWQDYEPVAPKSENPGPGAASVSDPNFGQKHGQVADHLNSLTDDFEEAATDNPHKFATLEDLGKRYQEDPTFRDIADAARRYAYNNNALVEGSRQLTGMDPMYRASETGPLGAKGKGWAPMDHLRNLFRTRFDGTMERGPAWLTEKDAQSNAETIMSAIRNSSEIKTPLYRGLAFSEVAPEFGEDEAGNRIDPVEALNEAMKTREVNPGYENYKGLKVGDKIDLPLSSFTTDESYAKQIAGDVDEYPHRFDSVVLELKGPHKSLNISPFNPLDLGEHVSNGTFEVTGVKEELAENSPIPNHKILKITVAQRNTY